MGCERERYFLIDWTIGNKSASRTNFRKRTKDDVGEGDLGHMWE